MQAPLTVPAEPSMYADSGMKGATAPLSFCQTIDVGVMVWGTHWSVGTGVGAGVW